MSNKIKILILMLVMLVVIILLPSKDEEEEIILPQHKMWIKEGDNEGIDERGNLTTHLPIIVIKTGGKDIPGVDRSDERRLLVEYSVINNKTEINNSTDKPQTRGKALMSVRGNSSRQFVKKQYLFKKVNDGGESHDEELLDMPSHSTWILNGSFIDHSQLRNYIIYNISEEIMDYVPRCRLCEVLFEDENGEKDYMGTYTVMEKPKVSKNRLKLAEYNPTYDKSSYMIQLNSNTDKYELDHLLINEMFPNTFDIEYPPVDKITKETIDYIQEDIYNLEKVLSDAKMNNDWEKVDELIDEESFIDYYIINEFFQNYDAGRRSTYIYKNLGGKFKMGPVWDFDGAFNNFVNIELPIYELRLKHQFYYYFLIQNPDFSNKCIQRYYELRESSLNEEYLLGFLKESEEYIRSGAVRNATKWYEDGAETYFEDIENMKKFIIERGRWMDENFEKLSKIIE